MKASKVRNMHHIQLNHRSPAIVAFHPSIRLRLMEADAGFLNHVQAGRPPDQLLTQAGPGRLEHCLNLNRPPSSPSNFIPFWYLHHHSSIAFVNTVSLYLVQFLKLWQYFEPVPVRVLNWFGRCGSKGISDHGSSSSLNCRFRTGSNQFPDGSK